MNAGQNPQVVLMVTEYKKQLAILLFGVAMCFACSWWKFLGPHSFWVVCGLHSESKKVCVYVCVCVCVCVYVWESSYKVGCRDELCYSEHNITRWPTSLEQSTHTLMYTQLPLLYRRTSPSTQKPLEKHWTPHQWGHAKQRPWQIMNQISPKSETN